MISFWITVYEPDVEAFCSTIMLPEYMSHLRVAPFRFADQPHNADGRQSLIVTFTGDGRLEEFPIHATKHAVNLLRFVAPEIDPAAVCIAADDAIWSWGRSFNDLAVDQRPPDGDARDATVMRLFFRPAAERLDVPFPPRFDPRDSYVSVSRRELFIGHEVFVQFFSAWIARCFGRPLTAFEAVAPGTIPLESMSIAGGIAFRYGRFGGEMSLENDTVLADLLAFSGLDRALAGVSGQVRLRLDAPEIHSDARGITLPLFP